MSHTFKKQFGQNFLRSDKFAVKLVEPLKLSAQDTVIEVGPGDGRVTRLLLTQAGKVICIEVDYQLLPGLIKRFGEQKNFELVHADILEAKVPEVLAKHSPTAQSYKLTGSLPYNIAKHIIYSFLLADLPPQIMSFIVQEEVAQDYVAQAPRASFLSNWIRLYAEVKKLESIPASQFFPQPKVNGAILVIKPHQSIPLYTDEIASLLRSGFASPRKTLRNNLVNAGRWESTRIDAVFAQMDLQPTIRPAELPFVNWKNIHNLLKN